MSGRSPRGGSQHSDPSLKATSPAPPRRYQSSPSTSTSRPEENRPATTRRTTLPPQNQQQHLNNTHHNNHPSSGNINAHNDDVDDDAPLIHQTGALVHRQPQHVTAETSTRGTDLRALLLTTERDMAGLREECTVRGSEVESLKENLQREHEASLRANARHHNELEDMREEYERQQGQLIEQITVLKGLSESALQDKHRIQEESTKSKISLLSMIESERDDKAQVMADYRQETEALIAEQGREITGLRHLLETARAEEEKLVESISKHEGRREELESDLLKGDAKLSEERVLGQKRIRELEQRHQNTLQTAMDKSSRLEQLLRQENLKLTANKDQLEDENRSLSERLKANEQQTEDDRKRLKDNYQADIAKLLEETKAAKARIEKAEYSHKREMEKTEAANESVNAALRRSIDALRAEKIQMSEEAELQRETHASNNDNKIARLHAEIDALRKEVGEERSARKNSESKARSLDISNEALETTVARLTTELEEHQVESRTRERQLEQEHDRTLEEVKDELREAESDNVQLRHQLKKVDLELQRLLDECDGKQSTLDSLRLQKQKESDQHALAQEKAQTIMDEMKRQNTRALDTLHGQKIQLEAELGRSSRQLSETESRLSAANKQLVDERQALERSIGDCQGLRHENGELRGSLEREHKNVAELTADLQEAEEERGGLQRVLEELNEAVRGANSRVDDLRREAKEAVRAREEEVSELRAAARLQMEKMEAEMQGVQESLRHAHEHEKELEGKVRGQKEEVARWQRECISKDEQHADALRALRQQEDEELSRMDEVINQLRGDLNKAHNAKNGAQKETATATRENERRVAIVQESLDSERATKHRLHDELRNKEQLNAELQGTVRLLHSRLSSKDDEIQRLDQEVQDFSKKIHDAHTSIGRKDAVIGQLNAKIRVFEHSSGNSF